MPLPSPSGTLRPWLRRGAFALVLAAVAWLYWAAALPRLHTAAHRSPTPDEARHLALAAQTWQDLRPDFSQSVSGPLNKLAPHRTDGVAQPLWPWLAAWFFDPADLPASQRRCVAFRLGLTLACILLLGITCARNFCFPGAVLITLVAAFHGFLPTVARFDGSALFHITFLLTWLACLYALQHNSLWVYGLAGMFGALAYISEDRILPLLILFILLSTLRALGGWLAAHWASGEGTTLWLRGNHIFGLLLLASGFFFLAGPRLAQSHQQFGTPFYSHVDHVRWLDDAETARQWIAAHPGASSLKKIPAMDRPGPQNYLVHHTRADIHDRLWKGFGAIWAWARLGCGYVLVSLLALLALLTGVARFGTARACHAGQRLHPETATSALFLVGATAIYLTIAAWDSPVWTLQHLEALIIPLALSLLWGCESVLRRARRRGARPAITRTFLTALWLIVALEAYCLSRGPLTPVP